MIGRKRTGEAFRAKPSGVFIPYLEEAVTSGEEDRLQAGVHAQLGEDARHVVALRLRADVEPGGDILRALAEELEAGLVVVGSRGLGAVRRALMGSVSDSVVRHAHCPVLVVRPRHKRSAEH